MKFVSNLSKEQLICSELRVKDYKELLKACYGDPVDKLIFTETLSEVFSKISNKPADFFKKLNIIDLFCLLLDLRINSLGDICKVIITKEEKKMNLELRLDFIRQDLETLSCDLSSIVSCNNIDIVVECPSVERLMQPTNEQYLCFIKGAYLNKNGTKTFVEISTNEQASLFFEKITPKIALQIIEQVERFIESVAGVNFLVHYGIEDQNLAFIPSVDSLIWFSKLMFSESVETFYDNLFYLCQLGHMGGEYVESLIVGEYNYFVSCLKRSLASQESSATEVSEELPEDEIAGSFEEQA